MTYKAKALTTVWLYNEIEGAEIRQGHTGAPSRR